MELPPGLVAAPPSLPQCPHTAFVEEACPTSTGVGSIEIVNPEALLPTTVFLLEPVPGTAAQLGFHVSRIPVTIDISIGPGPTYDLIASITNVSQVRELLGTTLKLEGILGGRPFLTLPRSCAAPLRTGFTATSWQDPAAAVLGVAPESSPLVNCGSLSYLPSLEVSPPPTGTVTPSGIDVHFDAPDSGITSVHGRAAADTQSATVTLSPGLTINPPVAAGLAVCTAAQLASEAPDYDPGRGCPEASKLGTATVTTPLFSKPIAGSVYLGEPEGAAAAISTTTSATHFALYLILRDAERGVLVSLPVHVDADSETGQLTVSLEQIPPLPISHLELHLNSCVCVCVCV